MRKHSTVLITLLLFGCAGTEVRHPSSDVSSLYSETHLDFAKWGRDPQKCCEASGTTLAISSGGPRSSQIGIEIKKKGGNIVDVVVAVAFALNVERPHSTSLGGGGFMTLHLSRQLKKDFFVDFRETAPQAATPALYLDGKGKPKENATLDGGLAVATPGMVAGLYDIHRRWGALPWAQVVEPARQLAEQGFAVYPSLAEKIESRKALLVQDRYTKSILFKPDGAPLKVGDALVQADLAKTLAAIAKKGKAALSTGELAHKIIASVKAKGGVLSEADLIQYRVQFREPLRGHFRKLQILTAPPPSAGGVALLEILGMLHEQHLDKLVAEPNEYLHRLTEVMKIAFADRAYLIADPAKVPGIYAGIQKVLDRKYWQESKGRIRERATPAAEVRPLVQIGEAHGTTQVSVLDDRGDAVSMTLTLNQGSFGAGFAAEGTGIFLNNEMDDFTVGSQANTYGLVSSPINAIEPRKRPVSSMTPTIVLDGKTPLLALGGAGGSKIISSVAEVVLNYVLLYRGDLRKSVFAPRIHHQWTPDEIEAEQGVSSSQRSALTSKGHRVVDAKWRADIEAVRFDPRDGRFTAVLDPRNQGGAEAYSK